MSRSVVAIRLVIASILSLILASHVHATDWAPRKDVGVAAVDTRTGKVLWEAWRLDEVPADASKEEKAAVEYLLATIDDSREAEPHASMLPDVPIEELAIKDPWPPGWDMPGPFASRGRNLIYYRHSNGVISLDRETKKEKWRLLTTRSPFPSLVLEVGANQALIQIGADVPATIRAVLMTESRFVFKKLEPYTLQQCTAAAMLLYHYGDGYLRPEVRKLAELLRKEKSENAAKDVEKMLADWPRKRDRQRLFDGCVAAVLGAADSNPLKGFAWPTTPSLLTWCLLQELIYGEPRDGYDRQGASYVYDGWVERPVSMPDTTKVKLADHCRKVIADGPDAEKPFAASVLVSTAVGWATLTNADRKKLFLSSEPSVWRWTAMALAKNKQRKELIEWSSDRKAEEHLDIVWVLQHEKPEKWADDELKFWLAVAKRDPGSIAYTLRLWGGPTPAELRETIRAYLKNEIAKPTVKNGGSQPAYNLQAAVYVLDGWQEAADNPLLLKYLGHPVHNSVTRLDGARQTELRVYGLRSHVRVMLEKRGVKVPDGVVYEQEIGN